MDMWESYWKRAMLAASATIREIQRLHMMAWTTEAFGGNVEAAARKAQLFCTCHAAAVPDKPDEQV